MSAVSAAIVEAIRAYPNGNGSLATTNQKVFVGEVPTLIHVRPFTSSPVAFDSFPVIQFVRVMPRLWPGFGRRIVRGLAYLVTLVFELLRRPDSAPPSHVLPPPIPTTRCVASRYECRGIIVVRCTHTCDMY